MAKKKNAKQRREEFQAQKRAKRKEYAQADKRQYAAQREIAEKIQAQKAREQAEAARIRENAQREARWDEEFRDEFRRQVYKLGEMGYDIREDDAKNFRIFYPRTTWTSKPEYSDLSKCAATTLIIPESLVRIILRMIPQIPVVSTETAYMLRYDLVTFPCVSLTGRLETMIPHLMTYNDTQETIDAFEKMLYIAKRYDDEVERMY